MLRLLLLLLLLQLLLLLMVTPDHYEHALTHLPL
jgi:hypothetical protein